MPKAEFITQYKGGTLRLLDAHKAVYAAYVKGLKDERFYVMSISPKRSSKSTKQLGYWYAVVVPTAHATLLEAGYNELGELSLGAFTVGMQTNTDLVDAFLKGLYALHVGVDEVKKRKMTTAEMSELTDFACRWIAENLGVAVPPPEELINVE